MCKISTNKKFLWGHAPNMSHSGHVNESPFVCSLRFIKKFYPQQYGKEIKQVEQNMIGQ